LKFSTKEASGRMEKLLRSAIANWEQKTEQKAENGNLYVSGVHVTLLACSKDYVPLHKDVVPYS